MNHNSSNFSKKLMTLTSVTANSDPFQIEQSTYFSPVIPLVISLISGIIIGKWLPDYQVFAYFLTGFSGCLILYKIIKKKSSIILPIILFFSLGYISIQPWISPIFYENHITKFTDSKKFIITGTVKDYPEKLDKRIRFIIETEQLKDKNNSFSVTGRIRVTVAGKFPDIQKRDKISFFSKIRSIHNFNNPGGFDYENYMKFKNIYGTAYINGTRIQILKKSSYQSLFGKVRTNISNIIDKTASHTSKGILKALIIGEKTQISSDLRDAFNRCGLGHLFAISGLHIGMVASVAFFIFKLILSRFTFLLLHTFTKKGAAILCLFPVIGYGILSGMSPSTQRAVIMVSLFLITFMIQREYDAINSVALAAMVILIFDPPSIFSISFQLSFTAIVSILYSISKIDFKINSQFSGPLILAKKLFAFFVVSLAAILGTLPFVMFYFNQISFTGLLTNFIFIPLIGFVVVPVGLFSVLLSLFSYDFARFVIHFNSQLVDIAVNIVHFFADMKFAAIKTITPSFFEICCYYLFCWSILNYCNKQTKIKKAKIVLILVLIAFSTDVLYWTYQRFGRDDLRVTILDVGQGGAGVLELPGGPVFLFDGGGFSDNSSFDVGAMVVAPFLWRKKIKTVDTIVLSHTNSDHLNGLLYIAKHFNVNNVWTNNESVQTLGYKRFINIIKDKRINMVNFQKMPVKYKINNVKLEILYPPKDFLSLRDQDIWRDCNNNSLVLRVEFKEKSFLFTGDIAARAEAEMVSIHGNRLQTSLLIAPHHGSKTSSSLDFLKMVNPEIVVISAGWKNRYNFPHKQVLKRYHKEKYEIFRTDIHGGICFSTNGKEIEIMPSVLIK